ncbi:MAG: tetratricopeptide repeat protein [Terracidiphilus sp.]|jgi:tetratricopeptide (TPR) repeat protein
MAPRVVESHNAYNLPDVLHRNAMRSWRVRRIGAGAAMTVFCALFASVCVWGQASSEASGDGVDSGAGGSRVLLVLPFDNRTGQPNLEWMREAAAEILSSRFASAGFQPTSRADRMYALDHLGLPQGFQPSRASAIKLAQTLDADSIVVGSYTTDGNGIVAVATLVDVPQLRMLPEVSARGEMKDLIAVFGELAWKLTKQLDPNFNVAEQTFAAAGNGIPLTAFEQYIRGITEPDQAERLRHLQTAVQLNPGFGQAWMALGREDYKGQQYQDAAEAFAKVDHNGPDGLEAGFYRGLSLMFSGDYPHAEEAFADVARVLPLAEVVNNEGVAESRQGKDGISLFIQAAAADPNAADYHFNLAVSLKHEGNLPGALNELAQCLKLRPSDSEAQSLNDAWKGKPGTMGTDGADPAADPLERIVRTFDESAFRQAAAMLDQMNAGRLTALMPRERAQRLCTQAKSFLDRGLLLEAERLYQDAAAADSASAQAHAGLAEVRERSGDADAARKEAHAALELGSSADAYLVLAQLDFAAGSLDEADTEAEDALKLDPANRVAQDLMRQIEAKRGR